MKSLDKKKTKELDNIVKTNFTLRGNRIGFNNGEIVKIKTRENWRETFYKEFGYLETPIDFYTNSAYANPKMKGIEHLDKLADFIQSLLTQQRTELLEEIKTRIDTWGGFEDDGGNLCHYDSEILEWVNNLLNKKDE